MIDDQSMAMIDDQSTPLYVASAADRQRRGVYALLCVVTGRLYIGGTRRTFSKRWTEHRLGLIFSSYELENPLRRDYQRLGPSAFVFLILEIVEPPTDLRERERFWLRYFASWGPARYNIHLERP